MKEYGVEALGTETSMPQPAPRPFAAQYAWRLLLSDAWAVVAFLFGLLGLICLLLGLLLALVLAQFPLAIIFILIGLLLVALPAAVIA